jgi:hypothetical protein
MSIELKPFLKEAEVAIVGGGLMLTLSIDFGVIDRLEGLLNRPMDELIGELVKPSMQGKFLWAMTRKYHSDISLDQCAGILFSEDGPAVMATLGNLVRATFNIGAPEGEGEKRSRPPKPRRSSGTSRASSKNGAQPTSAQRTSGRKRPARS